MGFDGWLQQERRTTLVSYGVWLPLLLLTLTVSSAPSNGAEFVVNKVIEHDLYRGEPIAVCRFRHERIAVFGDSNFRPGYVAVQEGNRYVDVVPSRGDWIAVQCPRTGSPEALAVSPIGVFQSQNGVSWESLFRLEKGRITTATFYRDAIFLATDQRQLLIWQGNQLSTSSLRIDGTPRRLHFSSRAKGVLWAQSRRGEFHAYWTADGGKTWTLAMVSVQDGETLRSFDSVGTGFFDEDHGVSIGACVIGRHTVGLLMATDDGGKSWQPLRGKVDPLEMQIKRIVELDPKHLLVVGNLALYILDAGSDELVRLKVRGTDIKAVLPEGRYVGLSATKQAGDVSIVADDAQRYILIGSIHE